MGDAFSTMQHSHLVLYSYVVLLSITFAAGKIVWQKKKVGAVGICIALLLLIPAVVAKQLSTFTMQLAYQVCKKADMAAYQMNAYNVISVLMMWLPWVVADFVVPKKEKEKKSKKQRRKQTADEDDDDWAAPEPKEKQQAAVKKEKKGKPASKKKD